MSQPPAPRATPEGEQRENQASAPASSAAESPVPLHKHHADPNPIVPAVMTLSYFAIAFALSRTSPSARETPRARYARSSLTPSAAGELVERLEARMHEHRWYRSPDLSLAELASKLDVLPQTLSQALNQQRGQSFVEFLAEFRLREARHLLCDPANDCYTVDSLARRSGFASRSAFYKVFRKAEGVTPTRYRSERRVEAAS